MAFGPLVGCADIEQRHLTGLVQGDRLGGVTSVVVCLDGFIGCSGQLCVWSWREVRTFFVVNGGNLWRSLPCVWF